MSTSPSPHCTDKEDCISKSQSNLSLSIGYFPYENTTDRKDITSSEDSTSECSSCHFLPPDQESWVTQSGRMPTGRQEQIQDDPEQLCKPIIQAVDIDPGSHYEDSRATLDLNRDYQRKEWINQNLGKLHDLAKYLKEFLDNQKDDKDDDLVFSGSPQDEDLQQSSSTSPDMYQVCCQEREACQALLKCNPSENEDISLFPEISPSLEEDELVEVRQPKEEDSPSHSGTTSCLNIRFIIHWLRKRVVFSLPRRKRPDTAHKDPSLLEPKKRGLLRGKRTQPRNPTS
uniref:Uncharacterized protein n=1 Tax=Spermophilus dauricus TaxID=99837 RepID=A0A8C9QF66_SPEDA